MGAVRASSRDLFSALPAVHAELEELSSTRETEVAVAALPAAWARRNTQVEVEKMEPQLLGVVPVAAPLVTPATAATEVEGRPS